METTVQVPKAFSVRDDNEFVAFKHLVARMNADLRVRQLGLGRHATGGYTVFWGLVYLQDQLLTTAVIDNALREAGFDFSHNSAQVNYDLVA